jgi:hypothetical protein
MRISPVVFIGFLSLMLSACQTPSRDHVAGSEGAPSPTGATPPDAEDTCGAKSVAWLVGANRDRVPKMPTGTVVRVVCSTCPMTMDFNASRLNVIYDEKTGNVLRLTCG